MDKKDDNDDDVEQLKELEKNEEINRKKYQRCTEYESSIQRQGKHKLLLPVAKHTSC